LRLFFPSAKRRPISVSLCYGLAAVGKGQAARELKVVLAAVDDLAGVFFGVAVSCCFFTAVTFAGAFTLAAFLLGVGRVISDFAWGRAFGATLPPWPRFASGALVDFAGFLTDFVAIQSSPARVGRCPMR
jgi:hypothetical protein